MNWRPNIFDDLWGLLSVYHSTMKAVSSSPYDKAALTRMAQGVHKALSKEIFAEMRTLIKDCGDMYPPEGKP